MPGSADTTGQDRLGPRGYLAEFPPRRWHVIVIVLSVAAIYLVGVTGRWWPTPDSALYQGLGRSLIRGEGYRFNGQVNNDVTPGMPMILGALRAVFGDGFLAPNLFVTLSGLLSVLLAYAALARLTDRRMALAVALGTAACYKYFYYSHLILTDATFSALFWALAYVSLRFLHGGFGWLLAAVGLAVAAVTVRAPGLLIIGPFAVGIVLHRNCPSGLLKRLVGGGAVLGAVGATAAVFCLLAQAASDKVPLYAAGRLVGTNVSTRLQTLANELCELPAEVARMYTAHPLTSVGVAFCLLAVLGMVHLCRNGNRLASATCVLFVLASGLLGGHDSIRARYMMAMFPLFLLLIVHGLCRLVELVRRWTAKPAKPKAFLVAMTVLLSCVITTNLPKVLRDSLYYSFHAHTGRYYEVLQGGRFSDLQPVAALLRDRFGPHTSIATRRDRASILHFLSERRTVRFLRTKRQTAAEAEAVYNDLLAKADIQAVVTDASGAPEPFRRRLDELLSASGAPVLYQGKSYKVYDWSKAGGTTRPATRRAP